MKPGFGLVLLLTLCVTACGTRESGPPPDAGAVGRNVADGASLRRRLSAHSRRAAVVAIRRTVPPTRE